MELTYQNSKLFLTTALDNVTQPGRTVDLMVRTAEDTELRERTEKIAHYLINQGNFLIPFFYEMRNEIPRGRMRQMLVQRAQRINDPSLKAFYLDACDADDVSLSNRLPLQSITVEGDRISVVFAHERDPEFVLLQKTMVIPFSDPSIWSQVEASHAAHQTEEAMMAEKLESKSANDEARHTSLDIAI